MDPSITLKITTLAEADSEKGKGEGCDGDITQATFVSAVEKRLRPLWLCLRVRSEHVLVPKEDTEESKSSGGT